MQRRCRAISLFAQSQHLAEIGEDFGLQVEHVGRHQFAGDVTLRAFTFRTDWPPEVGGQDSGPSPGEALVGALGGCVAMTYIAKAALRGIEVDELEVSIEATVDLRGAFELDAVRAGLTGATVTVKVRSDADDAVLDELGRTVTRASGVFDSLANPVPLQLAVERLP